MFSSDKQLQFEKLLVFGALGLYLFKHIKLQREGKLGENEPDLLLKIDRKKMFDAAEKHFSMNPAQRMMMEGVFTNLFKNEDE